MSGDRSLLLHKKLREKEAEIKILRQINETISRGSSLEELLKMVIKIVSRYLASDSCFIYLIENSHLILQASQNPHRAALFGKIKMKKGEGITGWVAAHKQSVVLAERASEDERFKFFNALPEDRYEAFLSVPITWKDRVVGVINVQHRNPTFYRKPQVLFLEIIAQLIGGAIENARLLSETNLLKEALETKKLVDRAKAVLMKKHNVTEAEAHRILNKASMDKRKNLREIAEAILLSQEILE